LFRRRLEAERKTLGSILLAGRTITWAEIKETFLPEPLAVNNANKLAANNFKASPPFHACICYIVARGETLAANLISHAVLGFQGECN
jgi:hypothetical protein